MQQHLDVLQTKFSKRKQAINHAVAVRTMYKIIIQSTACTLKLLPGGHAEGVSEELVVVFMDIVCVFVPTESVFDCWDCCVDGVHDDDTCFPTIGIGGADVSTADVPTADVSSVPSATVVTANSISCFLDSLLLIP